MHALRNQQLDTIKFLLIVLVVFGHLVKQMVAHSPLAGEIYTFIYVFHMPAFAFVSGMTSKRHSARDHLLGLALILMVFQILYVALFAAPGYPYWTYPYSVLWFIASLLCWRLLLPLFYRIPFPVAASFAIALASGLIPWIGLPFSLSRTLVFLPFFVLGHVHGAAIARWCQTRSPAAKTGLVAIFLLIMLAVSFLPTTDPSFNDSLFHGADAYANLGLDSVHGLMMRFTHFCGALCGIALLFLTMPEREWFGSRRGAKVLPVYLLHMVCVIPLAGVMAALSQNHIVAALALALIATAWMCYVFSADAVFAAVNWLYKPKHAVLSLRTMGAPSLKRTPSGDDVSR